MKTKLLVLYSIFIVSLFILVVKLLMPSNVYVIVVGTTLKVYEVPQVYTLGDVLIIVTSSVVASATGVLIYTWSSKKRTQEKIAIKSSLEKVSIELLKGLEKDIYKLLVAKGGSMYQSDILRILNIPKSTLSVVLSRLEAKGIIERKRVGLRNIVKLKTQRV